jgi:DNA excision repair protein ERCC-6
MTLSIRFGNGGTNPNQQSNMTDTSSPTARAFGTSGTHFIALERVRRRLVDELHELVQKKEMAKLQDDEGSTGSSRVEDSMIEVRLYHLKAKVQILDEVRDASEQQLITDTDQKLARERAHAERQREIHRVSLDPENIRAAELDRLTHGQYLVDEANRQRRTAERQQDRHAAVATAAATARKSKRNKKRKSEALSKSRSTEGIAVKRVSRSKKVNPRSHTSTQCHVDDASDVAYWERVENHEEFEALEGTDAARISSTCDDVGEEDEEDEEDVVIGDRLVVPASMYDKLFPYQQRTVAWMWGLHEKHVGGILGDEMGLGKTIQIIAFLAALHNSGFHRQPTLILCPATVMVQWLEEIHKWYPAFRVWLLHPSSSSLNMDMSPEQMLEKAFEVGDIVITTYSTFRSKNHMFLRRHWGYVVCDEGHVLRNMHAGVTQVAKQINTTHRLLLTGAPMQNNLKELWCLFDFVCPSRLGTLSLFETQFIDPIRRGGYVNATKMQVQMAFRCATVLREVIEPYLLRRLKSDVAKQLPKKTERVLFCKITGVQRNSYERCLAGTEVHEVLNGDRQSFKAITMLRKICNHVDLLHAHNDLESKQRNKYGKDWQTSGKMLVMDKVLERWSLHGDKVLVFSQTRQMLDIIETYMEEKGYTYLRMDGETPVKQRQDLVNDFNESEQIFVFLLTTRVGGLGLNLTGANRVILFDPDWNPSVDVQARERVWRIGQKESVTIYRLITTGTIEEKMYHRQIFKTFLANKVLKDPRQKRFFKSQDLYDLFTLAPEHASEGGTETGLIFGQGSEVRKGVEIEDEPSDASGSERNDDVDDRKVSSLEDDRDVLKALWNGDTLQSAFKHDIVDHNMDWDGHNSVEATRGRSAASFARSSHEALRQSRHEAMLARLGADVLKAPTATAGRFGGKVNPHIKSNASAASSYVDAGARIILSSNSKVSSSATLLSKMRDASAEIEPSINVPFERPNFLIASSSEMQRKRKSEDFLGVALNRGKPNPNDMHHRMLVLRADLLAFLKTQPEIATTEMILEIFGTRVRPEERKAFKQTLRSVATCEDGFWTLKS